MKKVILYSASGSVIGEWITDTVHWDHGTAYFQTGQYKPGEVRYTTHVSGTIVVTEADESYKWYGRDK
jgi:hypothetical protein